MTRCYKCRRDMSYTEDHHIVPQHTGLEIDETVKLCSQCHKCISRIYNDFGGLTEDQHRELFERYSSTGMTPEWDYMLFGVLLYSDSYEGIEENQKLYRLVKSAYDIFVIQDDVFEDENNFFLNVWWYIEKCLNGDRPSLSDEDEVLFGGFLEREMQEIRMKDRLDNK